jgi:hypothetical protein
VQQLTGLPKSFGFVECSYGLMNGGLSRCSSDRFLQMAAVPTESSCASFRIFLFVPLFPLSYRSAFCYHEASPPRGPVNLP